MAESPPLIIRPVPRRPFSTNHPPAFVSAPSPPPAHAEEEISPKTIRSPPETPSYFCTPLSNSRGDTPSSFRTSNSTTNLTDSTLFGIYGNDDSTFSSQRQSPDPADLALRDLPSAISNWSSRRDLSSFDLKLKEREKINSIISRRRTSHNGSRENAPFSRKRGVWEKAWRVALLFFCGMCYGLMVFHLQSERPGVSSRYGAMHVQVRTESYGWKYVMFWGMAGVGLGSLLPWVDGIWEDVRSPDLLEPARDGDEGETAVLSGKPASAPSDAELGADWNPVVRSIGVFVGIAFAIRKIPWTSTLQVSLTLSLVNPVLWYLIDRSLPGLILASLIGGIGTFFLLTLNPEYLAPPIALTIPTSTSLSQSSSSSSAAGINGLGRPNGTGIWNWRTGVGRGMLDAQALECGIWIASVLFCSAVCFGGIGRRLALTSSKKLA